MKTTADAAAAAAEANSAELAKGSAAASAKQNEQKEAAEAEAVEQKEAAVKILVEMKGISEAQARDMCRSPVVPVLKGVSEKEADAAKKKFKAAKVNCRVTSKKRRK